MYRVYEDRRTAGRALVPELQRCDLHDPIILGLPRGGVPLAYEIAVALRAPLDTIVVRKLGVPSQPELAFGAIASGGVRVINDDVVRSVFGLDDAMIEHIADREMRELQRREQAYRLDRPYPQLEGMDVVLVDDGLATGATMRAAAEAVKTNSPASVIVAVPVGSSSAVTRVAAVVDRVICLESPASFYAVGQFYADFRQTSDEEVRELLQVAWGMLDTRESGKEGCANEF
jgi:putative phosphoribosyl transferase